MRAEDFPNYEQWKRQARRQSKSRYIADRIRFRSAESIYCVNRSPGAICSAILGVNRQVRPETFYLPVLRASVRTLRLPLSPRRSAYEYALIASFHTLKTSTAASGVMPARSFRRTCSWKNSISVLKEAYLPLRMSPP